MIFLIIFSFLFYDTKCQVNDSINTETEIGNIELEGVYKIVSVYNRYTLSIKENDLLFSEEKDGGNFQRFSITYTYSDPYSFIISKKENKRLGIDEENRLHMYKLKDNENIEKTYWKLINYNNDPNIFLIQNAYNKKFLEIKKENNNLRCKNEVVYDPKKKLDQVKNENKFYLLKLYQELKVRPIDIEMLKKEPIDVVIKYIDYTDKSLEIPNDKRKENDFEGLKYSIRSILKYVSWIRKIYIVMPNTKVRFFKPIEEIKDKIVYIQDKDIIGFNTLNSGPLQFNLFKLEKFGVSKNFIYMDDNNFFGGDLNKQDLFYYDDETKKVVPYITNNDFQGKNKEDIINKYNELFNKKDKLNPNDNNAWSLSLFTSEKLLIDNYNISLINVEFIHSAIPLNIDDLKEINDFIISKYKYANETLNSHEKNILTPQPQHLFSLYALNIKKRKVNSISLNYLSFFLIQKPYLYNKLIGLKIEEKLIPQNSKIKDVLESRYPDKSKFEIDYEEKKEVEKKEIEKKEEEETSYINRTELNRIENKLKNKLNYYIIAHLGLIIGILVVIFVIIYYFFDIFKKDKLSRHGYGKIENAAIINN